jgi:hypothetical protein
MIVNKASIQIGAVVAFFAWAACPPLKAEDTAQHANESRSCARSSFRVLVDVGHTATSPGADSARGVPEYEFNLKLANVIAQSLHEAGFDKTVRLIWRRNRYLPERTRRRRFAAFEVLEARPRIVCDKGAPQLEVLFEQRVLIFTD